MSIPTPASVPPRFRRLPLGRINGNGGAGTGSGGRMILKDDTSKYGDVQSSVWSVRKWSGTPWGIGKGWSGVDCSCSCSLRWTSNGKSESSSGDTNHGTRWDVLTAAADERHRARTLATRAGLRIIALLTREWRLTRGAGRIITAQKSTHCLRRKLLRLIVVNDVDDFLFLLYLFLKPAPSPKCCVQALLYAPPPSSSVSLSWKLILPCSRKICLRHPGHALDRWWSHTMEVSSHRFPHVHICRILFPACTSAAGDGRGNKCRGSRRRHYYSLEPLGWPCRELNVRRREFL